MEDGEGGVKISVDMEIDRVLVFWSSVLRVQTASRDGVGEEKKISTL